MWTKCDVSVLWNITQQQKGMNYYIYIQNNLDEFPRNYAEWKSQSHSLLYDLLDLYTIFKNKNFRNREKNQCLLDVRDSKEEEDRREKPLLIKGNRRNFCSDATVLYFEFGGRYRNYTWGKTEQN